MFSISKLYWSLKLLGADHLLNVWFKLQGAHPLFVEVSELQGGRNCTVKNGYSGIPLLFFFIEN